MSGNSLRAALRGATSRRARSATSPRPPLHSSRPAFYSSLTIPPARLNRIFTFPASHLLKAATTVATHGEQIMRKMTAVVMALGLMLPAMTLAQDGAKPARPAGDRPPQREGGPANPDGPRQGREGGPGGRGQMVPPLFAALDTNGDKVLDADEIKNAAESLKKLDKDGDGKITMEEMRPARPDGDRGPGPGQGEGQRPRREGPPREN